MKPPEIIYDLSNKDKIYYVSGYDNEKCNKKANTNTKPTKVIMQLASSHYESTMFNDHLVPVVLDENNNPTKRLEIYMVTHSLFETLEESIEYYNKRVNRVLEKQEEKYNEIREMIKKNLIKN